MNSPETTAGSRVRTKEARTKKRRERCDKEIGAPASRIIWRSQVLTPWDDDLNSQYLNRVICRSLMGSLRTTVVLASTKKRVGKSEFATQKAFMSSISRSSLQFDIRVVQARILALAGDSLALRSRQLFRKSALHLDF
jgi:hypothetical protein